MRTCCPSCDSVAFKKNGINQYGDQNHKCLDCGKQFVLDPQQKLISEETRKLIRSLLLERLSLRAICRVTGVSKTWLLGFIKEVYSQNPLDLNVSVPPDSLGLILERIEADELWSFVGSKKKSGKTSLIEGVNCILRQRVGRLVRKTVSFSKLFVNHMGAIRYFLSYYNLWAYEKFLESLDIVDIVIA